VKLPRLVPLLAAAVLLSGCGGGGGGSDNGVADKSADDIVAAALDAAQNADSVYVHGGTTTGNQPIQIDMHLVRGQGGAGHLVANGLSFDLVRIGDKAYFKGDADFWKQFGGATLAQLLADKWVEAPAKTGDLASLTPLTDVGQLFNAILTNHGTLEKGDTTDVNGTSAITVKDTDENGTLYVATEGQPYPLKLEGGGDAAGTMEFENWDESYDLKAPEGALDLEKLKAAGGG
jgi:hypothetical protein